MKSKLSLFGVVHLVDQTIIAWDCITFFAARAWAEKTGKPHSAFYTASSVCQADPERCAAVREAWDWHNATTQVNATTAEEFLAVLNAA
jgi:hypothetical protein